jgi:hypothetical protein
MHLLAMARLLAAIPRNGAEQVLVWTRGLWVREAAAQPKRARARSEMAITAGFRSLRSTVMA